MKKYNLNFKINSNTIIKKKVLFFLKMILKILGIKYLVYKILFFILRYINGIKSYFIRGLIFDIQKPRNKLLIVNNDFNEKFVIFSYDDVISKELYINGEFDLKKLEKTIEYFYNQGNPIENLFDIGANIGVISIPAVKRGLIKKAFAVEPEPQNYTLLKTNIILNNLEDKVIPYNYALSDTDDKIINMELSSDNSGDHRIKEIVNFNIHNEEKRQIIKVKTKKFDSLFKEINQKNNLVWIDTQGFEPKVLSGAENLINNKVPVVIEFWPYALKRAGLWKSMIEFLYRFDLFIDLSKEKIIPCEINQTSIDKLIYGWQDEKKGSPSLFTDLVLLKN
tara:strand:+ start:203 stop:1210 length:1008 start_codon:yes stop_codon:yes gene_type:complete